MAAGPGRAGGYSAGEGFEESSTGMGLDGLKEKQMARRNLLKGFKRPKGITFEHGEGEGNYGRFIAYPFERGYGTTIGNSLRRILLSSIQGYAVTAVKITSYDADNTPHIISSEYEAIPEVVEDTPEIIANLKLLQIKLPEEVEQKMILVECKGKSTLTGKDLEKDNDITVMNKDLKIMTLMDKANIDIELQIDLGRGYVPAETNEKYVDVVGTIPIDAVFSPVKKVSFTIENTRVGHRNDYDKLVLDVWTDGTISPENALAEAAKIAKDHFTFNNTIVTITDLTGNTISWASAGGLGFRGAKKSTPYAAQTTAETAAKKALDTGLHEVHVFVKGPGVGRESAIRSLGTLGLWVKSIKDMTPIPHNGCRPRKSRRV